MFRRSALIVALLSLANVALADPPTWAPSLRTKLQKAEGCEVMYLTGVKEYELFGRDVVEVRAHCEDGRAFDVTRGSANEDWKIVLCKPVAC